MFAVELMMPEVSVRTFLPVALATGTATFIDRLYFDWNRPFACRPWPRCLIVRLIGLAATAFIKGFTELKSYSNVSETRTFATLPVCLPWAS